MRGCFNIMNVVVASILWVALSLSAFAAGAEPAKDLLIDPAPCLVAAAVGDDNDKVVSTCGALIEHEKTDRADRIKALIARGGAFERMDMIDRAISAFPMSATARARRR